MLHANQLDKRKPHFMRKQVVVSHLLSRCWHLVGALFDMTGGYFWCTLVLTCSQTWALYNLVLFYHVMYDELLPLKPLVKFVSIKSIIFFPFWQVFNSFGCLTVSPYCHVTNYRSLLLAVSLSTLIVCVTDCPLCSVTYYLSLACLLTPLARVPEFAT